MPRRATLPCILLGLCLVPGAALAAGPVTPRSATPNAAGLQIDPSVAATPSGQRLVAATNADGPTVDVWQPDTNAPGVNTTWSHATASDVNGPVPATHPALGWDGGATAHLVTAPPQTCATGDVKLQTWDYDVSSKQLTQKADISNLDIGRVASWPRVVIGIPTGDLSDPGVGGKAITVYDEEDCATGDHRVVLALEGQLGLPLQVASGRMPSVSAVDTVTHNGRKTTELEIAYLSEPMNGQQDVLAITCWLGAFGGLPLLDCQGAPAIVDNNIVEPGQISSGGTTVEPLAAPGVACENGACHVVWTEGSGSGRTHVYVSHASGDLTMWSARQQVASAAGNSASQFMPSVATHGSRVDVVYVDTRGNPSFDAFQTSFDGAVRGLDTSLTNGDGYSPGPGALLGDRSDATSFGTKGTVYGYFPGQVSAEPPSVVEGQVDHGTVAPKLMLHAQSKSTGKNTATTIATWLSYSDTDGDPVTFTVADPAHGSVMGSTYTPDATYAGGDSIAVGAYEPGSSPVCPTPTSGCDSTTHTLTITNQAPVFDAPLPAIVDEGGEVVVPLHATDADTGDVVNFSVVTPAPAPFNVAGRASTDASGNLHLKIPAGVRAMGPVTLMLRATDTTTGPTPAGVDQQSIDVTIRPNLKTPVVSMDSGNVSTTGRRATVTAPVAWSDSAAGCLTTGTCHVRRTWTFGDGTAPVTTLDAQSTDHVFPAAGVFRGQVTAVILWGSAQVAAAPRAFNVTVVDDGRVLFKVTPTVRRPGKRRIVTVRVTARATGQVTVSMRVKGLNFTPKVLKLAAGQTGTATFSFGIRKVKVRRGTIRVTPSAMLASGVAPTPVSRAFRF
jgi:hypothetical protein